MNAEDIYAGEYILRHLSAAAYVIISMLGGMAILLFALAIGYQVLQLINSII